MAMCSSIFAVTRPLAAGAWPVVALLGQDREKRGTRIGSDIRAAMTAEV